MHAFRHFTSRAFALLGTAVALITIAACGSGASTQQVAYDACTKTWNNKMRLESSHKALVAGISHGDASCYSAWQHPNGVSAINAAMANCRADGGKCYVWASDLGPTDWVRKMSNNGGSDGSRQRSREQDDALASTLTSTLMTGAGLWLGYYGTPVGLGGSSSSGSDDGGYSCVNDPNATACK